MGRAPCCDKAKVKRGPWSPDEDELLKTYIQQQNGVPGNWIALPGKAGLKRCGKSCRLRWLNYLRPDIKRGGFTEEEDRVIYALYSQIGSRWSVIAGYLHGRTDNDVKNHWNTKLKKRLINISINGEGNNSIYIPTDHDAFPQLMISNHPEDYHIIRSTLLYQLAASKTPSLTPDHQMNFVPPPPGLSELSHFVSNAASNFSSPEVPSVSSSTCMAAAAVASDDHKCSADPWPNYKIEVEGEEDNEGALIHMMGGFGNPYSGFCWLPDEKVGLADDCHSTHNLGELLYDEIDIKPDPAGLIQGGTNQF